MVENGNPPETLYGRFRVEYEEKTGEATVYYKDKKLTIVFPDEIQSTFKDFLCECEDVDITCKDVTIKSGDVKINTGKVEATTGSVQHTATGGVSVLSMGEINLTAPTITLNGIVNINGTLNITGILNVTGAIVCEGPITAAAFIPGG